VLPGLVARRAGRVALPITIVTTITPGPGAPGPGHAQQGDEGWG
jgi:hypothetical protein